jgi:prefoldin subunit 5
MEQSSEQIAAKSEQMNLGQEQMDQLSEEWNRLMEAARSVRECKKMSSRQQIGQGILENAAAILSV